MNSYKTLLSNTMWIGIGTMGSKLLVFLMVRFYTEFLTPGDFGTADLITQTAALLYPVISLGMTESVFRFCIDLEKQKQRVFSAGTMLAFCGFLSLLVILPILNLVSVFHGYVHLIGLYATCAGLHSLCAQYVRAQGKTSLYAAQGVLNTMLMIGFSILLVAVLRRGVTGYVLAIILADLCVAAFLFIKEKLWRDLTTHVGTSIPRRMLAYGIPLIPTTVFWWITAVSDRYMVTGFYGKEANGLYSVAYRIPTMLALISGVFIEAWQYSAMSEADKAPRAKSRFFRNVWNSYMALLFVSCSLIIATAQVSLFLLAKSTYHSAWIYIPVLALATVFSAFSSFFGSFYLVDKKSMLSFRTAMLGAGTNVVLNLVLLPSPLGVQGAAVATLVSYFVVFVIRAWSADRHLKIKECRGLLLANLLCVSVQTGLALSGVPGRTALQAICFVVVLAVNYRPLGRTVYLMWRGVRQRLA